jgi:hypothetical protein
LTLSFSYFFSTLRLLSTTWSLFLECMWFLQHENNWAIINPFIDKYYPIIFILAHQSIIEYMIAKLLKWHYF